jgi:hypothetical protein
VGSSGRNDEVLVGKGRVDRLALAFGHRVETVVRSEHARGDSIQFLAVQIRLNEPKKAAPTLNETRAIDIR